MIPCIISIILMAITLKNPWPSLKVSAFDQSSYLKNNDLILFSKRKTSEQLNNEVNFPFGSTFKSIILVPEEPVSLQKTTVLSPRLQLYTDLTDSIASILYVSSEDIGTPRIVLSNLCNNMVKEYPVSIKVGSEIEVNISDLPSGIYFYTVITNDAKALAEKLSLVN